MPATDVTAELPSLFPDLGLDNRFANVVSSEAFGWEKPSPAIPLTLSGRQVLQTLFT